MSTNCVNCIKNKRTWIDLLCDDCRRKEIEKAIENIKSMREIHIDWAEYFSADSDIEKKYVETEERDTAEKHFEIVNQYNRVLSLLLYLEAKENE